MTDRTQVSTRPSGLGMLLPLTSLGVSIACAALGVWLLYRRVDWNEVGALLLNLDKTWFFAAVACYWAPQTINSLRLQLVIRWLSPAAARITVPLKLVFRVVCAAGFIGVVAPIGLVADAAKIGALRLTGELSLASSTRAILFDRIVAVQWMTIFGVAWVGYQALYGVAARLLGIQLLVFSGVIAGIIMTLTLPRLLHLLKMEFFSKIATMFSGYRLLLTPDRSLIQAGITFINTTMVWGTLYCILRAAGLQADLLLVASFVPFLQIINSVPFLYLGWGGRELAMAATLGTVGGLSLNEALAVSAAWGLVLMIAGAANAPLILGTWRSNR